MKTDETKIEKMMYPKEVADLLQVSERTITRMASDSRYAKRLGAKKVGPKQWRFVRWRVELFCMTQAN